MKKRRSILLILLLVSAVALLTGLGIWFYSHGEWWFPLLYGKKDRPVAVTRAPDVESKEWRMADLLASEDVTVDQTLLLINESHRLPADFLPHVIEYNGAKMHPSMRDPYIAMRDAVQTKTGVRIYVSSDFRTKEEQEEIAASSEDGIAATPGSSEHEAGLALDLYAPYAAGMDFLRSSAGREVNRICGEYGFIIRYPYEKQDVTGIAYEPWHVRYVGAPHAKLMSDSGLTMEEYLQALTPEVWFCAGEYRILRTAADTVSLPIALSSCHISPDNTGHYIITVKMK